MMLLRVFIQGDCRDIESTHVNCTFDILPSPPRWMWSGLPCDFSLDIDVDDYANMHIHSVVTSAGVASSGATLDLG